MDNLTEYQILEIIKEQVKTIIYRGIRKRDREPVILKALKQEYPNLEDIARLRHEYKIIKDLALPGVVKAISLKKYNNGLAIILEDFGGESLRDFLRDKKLEFNEFLPIAISLVNSLADLHQRKIIHKDINPGNIIINSQTREVKITDFGISTLLEQETQTSEHPNLLEGTFAYMSPEQTGRMNRSIDYRTDFYSLGATFYEMLTGVIPFFANDPMEFVHCHIAQRPVPPYQKKPEIPKIISDIVMKLLSKTAEERYQTAFGLRRDLETCLNQLVNTGKISLFTIGQEDLSAQLQIPQKLYGREKEVATLMAAFDRVSQGQTEMVLVAGYSGIGKSSIVYEIHKPIVRQRGFFISGKFDQYQRNVPYAALIQAFRQLICQLLTETEDQIVIWKETLLKALGVNGQIIIDVIPEVELIIGKQPPIPQLSPTESQNRFNLVFQDFIQIFTQPEHPLVLFLDDLQWSDSASLKLIHLLITSVEQQYLLIIGAYRDNEVSPSHPLMLMLDEIQKTATTINRISIQPLALNHVNTMIIDTLHCDSKKALPLAELCQQKADGNPFFLNQILQTLYVDHLIVFDSSNGYWQWDIEQIKKIGITDNVVELTIAKIMKLSEKTQNLLKLAACIGNKFDLDTLSIINEKSLAETATELWEALEKGLIIPLSDHYKIPLVVPEKSLLTSKKDLKIDYKFLHDRIQQSAYALIAETDRKKTHLKIGRLLKENTKKSDLKDKIFDVVNHLNEGSELIEDQKEIYELAELNLKAGKKAKDSIAYKAALKYFQKGTGFLPKNSWQKDYKLTFVLHKERAECEYLSGYFQESEKLFDLVLKQAKSNREKADIQTIRLTLYVSTSKYLEALQLGSECLKIFNLDIPIGNTESILAEFERELQIYRTNLDAVEIADLININKMSDPEIKACMNILVNLTDPAYFLDQDLFILITLKIVNISMKYGNSENSARAYSLWGFIAISSLGEYNCGYEFGKMALKLVDKYENANLSCITSIIFGSLVSPWKEHLKTSIYLIRKGHQIAKETANLIFSCTASQHLIVQRIIVGDHLSNIIEESHKLLDWIGKIKNDLFAENQRMFQGFILNLQGLTQDKFSFDNSQNGFDANIFLQICQKFFLPGVATYNILKAQILYLYGNYESALEISKESQNILGFVSGMPNQVEHYLYYSLTLTNLYLNTSEEVQKEYWKILKTNQEKLQIWADNCPENYLHKYLLVTAEISRICGQELDAIDLYDQAIESAQENEFINNQAVANELAGKFWLTRGNQKIAKVYMKEAYHNYQVWGAQRKVDDLAEKYPHLLSEMLQKKVEIQEINSTTFSSSSSKADILDLTTVIKAYQSISCEINLEKLLKNLMKILIENAGAQKGFLILNNQRNWVIEAQGTLESEQATILQSIPIESVHPETLIPILPTTIINYVIRTQENVILKEATQEGQFINDPYIQTTQSQSILCTPLINQGQLRGIIYLENNLTTGAFTSDRVELLNILSAQAAISIDNSRLYSQVRENESRLAQFLDAMPVGVAILDASARICYLNRVGKKLLGKGIVSDITSEQIASTYQLYKISTGQEYQSHELPIIQALQGKSLTTEDVEVRQNNKIIPLENFSTPVYNEQGKIIYAIGSFIDITERKKAEADRERFTNELFKLNKAYERFVPKQFLDFLDKESIVDVELGDQVRLEMSVLFSDIRNFTTMSEAMTPEDNFRFINSYLSSMEPAILENQGFIDKYIGDAIMALFCGDADNAVKAGISMLKRLSKYNQHRLNSGDSPIDIGIGINTGLLMLGTVGGKNRMDGTVISDAVNLASRVESLTKNYGVSLLITEQTFSRLTQPSNYAIRSIATVKVKGKLEKVTVYEVFDADPPVVKEGKLNTLQQFTQAISLYNSGQLLEAGRLFAECLKFNPSDRVAQIYLQGFSGTGEMS
ncbi:MAG: AAA family ATPase [Cyanobacteria bacterium J06592_8]